MHRLSEAQLLRGVDDQSLEVIANAGEILEVPTGQRIIEEGAVPEKLVLLLSGKLEVFVPVPADRSQGKRLATIKPGDSCGEYGFVDRRPASASVKAVENSEIFIVTIAEFDALLGDNHELERIIYRNLLGTLVNRLRASNVVIDMLRSPTE